jgi:hypothetical protein
LRGRCDRPHRCWYVAPDAVCRSLGRAGAGSATARTRTRLQRPAAAELFAPGGHLAAFLLGQSAGQATSGNTITIAVAINDVLVVPMNLHVLHELAIRLGSESSRIRGLQRVLPCRGENRVGGHGDESVSRRFDEHGGVTDADRDIDN